MEGTHKEKEKKVGGGRIILYRVSPARRRSGRSDANWKRARAHRATRKSEDEISRKSNETKWGGGELGPGQEEKVVFMLPCSLKKKKKNLSRRGSYSFLCLDFGARKCGCLHFGYSSPF